MLLVPTVMAIGVVSTPPPPVADTLLKVRVKVSPSSATVSVSTSTLITYKVVVLVISCPALPLLAPPCRLSGTLMVMASELVVVMRYSVTSMSASVAAGPLMEYRRLMLLLAVRPLAWRVKVTMSPSSTCRPGVLTSISPRLPVAVTVSRAVSTVPMTGRFPTSPATCGSTWLGKKVADVPDRNR